jgi:RND family efflux transporter MFP subunit
MKTANSAKILLAVAGVFGTGVLLWPATSDFRAHLFEARAQSPEAPKAGAPAQNRPPVNVRIATVSRGPLPYIAEAVGTVQPIASVAIRSRIDAQIESVLVPDGAAVKAGDVLVKLDSRQVEAQIKQAEAQLAKDRTVLEQAERDVGRFSELVSKQTGTQVNLDNARTAAAAARAAIMGDQAQIENLNVQLSWYTIKAPITGRVSTFSLKAGNIVRSGDSSSTGTLTTIVQTTPIYVLFSVPQRLLTDVREAVSRPDAEVTVTPQGATRSVKGRVSVIDNAIDSATGTVTVRATFENADEMLWSGQLCQVRMTLRVDPEVVSIPREAVQTGQNGNYVFVVEDNVAKVRTVELGRSQEGRDIVSSGLKGGEIVVTDGALALTNGARVDARSADVKKGNS